MSDWRCFFCDEVFTDREVAAEHFGATADTEPVCVATRDKSVMELVIEMNHLLKTSRTRDEILDHTEQQISNYEFFCRKLTGKPSASMNDVMLRIDSLEGRLFAAEARLKALRALLDDSEPLIVAHIKLHSLVEEIQRLLNYETDVPDLSHEEKQRLRS